MRHAVALTGEREDPGVQALEPIGCQVEVLEAWVYLHLGQALQVRVGEIEDLGGDPLLAGIRDRIMQWLRWHGASLRRPSSGPLLETRECRTPHTITGIPERALQQVRALTGSGRLKRCVSATTAKSPL